MAILTNDEIIRRFRLTHGDTYDYSLVSYKGQGKNLKVTIICKIHGPFEQAPSAHIRGCRCPRCARKLLSSAEFIDKCNIVHNNFYDYSKTTFIEHRKNVQIICPDHGEFSQRAMDHITGTRCPYCAGVGRQSAMDFYNNAIKVHGNTYTYDLSTYTRTNKLVSIFCSIHGEFKQFPYSHLRGAGCATCVGYNRTTESFIEELRCVHGEKYDYSKVEYTGAVNKISIGCSKHGYFEQSASAHLRGAGCRKCSKCGTSNQSNEWLDYMAIPNNKEHREVRTRIGKKLYIFDGFIPETNTVYEYWGHYYHGNLPKRYPPDSIHPTNGKTYRQLYKETKIKIKAIKNAGYNLVDIWEKDWLKLLETINHSSEESSSDEF